MPFLPVNFMSARSWNRNARSFDPPLRQAVLPFLRVADVVAVHTRPAVADNQLDYRPEALAHLKAYTAGHCQLFRSAADGASGA